MEQNGRGKESGTIGSRIRNLRNRDGMSQEQLALLLHFENKGTISSYETDRRTVPSDVVIRLAEIFQTTTDYLLCGKYPERNIREVDPEMQEMMEVMLSLRSDAARKAALLQIRALADMERNLLP
ncbi:helix-turn-helix domain-containing protein [Bacillota bacterium LCP21S3_G6]|jgi:transcriptional regulator with XRE-family HTH domain|uniref:helix-turn-helix domain-containing protein n=1 Tax=Bacillota TaxID=1239 RepID=UPI0022E6116D|nr:helix-turn-helix transcriptional regulator [Acidaminococcus provencensis]